VPLPETGLLGPFFGGGLTSSTGICSVVSAEYRQERRGTVWLPWPGKRRCIKLQRRA
jgi:hypothetical protein